MSEGPDSEPPEPPDEVPQYIADGLGRQDADDLEHVIEYARDLLAYRRSAPSKEEVMDTDGEVIDTEQKDNYTEVIKKVECGKDCSGCPHGPYVYRVRYAPGGLKWEYRGPLHEFGED